VIIRLNYLRIHVLNARYVLVSGQCVSCPASSPLLSFPVLFCFVVLSSLLFSSLLFSCLLFSSLLFLCSLSLFLNCRWFYISSCLLISELLKTNADQMLLGSFCSKWFTKLEIVTEEAAILKICTTPLVAFYKDSSCFGWFFERKSGAEREEVLLDGLI